MPYPVAIRALRESVTEGPDTDLGQRRRALGRTLDRVTTDGGGAEHRRQIDRQQRVEQFAGGVLQKDTAESTRTCG